jgi:uncharacterized C2H2 Zn-finger protein
MTHRLSVADLGPMVTVVVWCPFCLHPDDKRKFEHYLKSGKLAGKYRCPSCGMVFYRTSAFGDERTVQDYAKWVVDYPAGLFFKCVDYDKWSAALKRLGISTLFWDTYHTFKPRKENVES